MSHEQIQDLIIAMACDTASQEETAQVEAHLDACPDCARWQELTKKALKQLAGDLLPVPERLDREIRALIAHGVPEDPWNILWEVAGGVTDLNRRVVHRQPTQQPETHYGQAAELVSGGEVPPVETLIRERADQTVTAIASGGQQVRLTVWDRSIVVGVVTSDGSVPLAGIEVELERGDRIDRCHTDGRGSFVFQGVDKPARLRIGPPVSVETQF